MTPTQTRNTPALVALALVDFAITAAVLIVFGLFGGFILLVALNGFSERQATPFLLGYYLLLLSGNAIVASLTNLLIRRLWPRASALTPLAAIAMAISITILLMFVAPLLVLSINYLAHR